MVICLNNEVSQADLTTGIPDGHMGLDCGPKSAEIFKKAILDAKTILWNGPPGVFEFEKFSACTKTLVDACVLATQNGATTIIGIFYLLT